MLTGISVNSGAELGIGSSYVRALTLRKGPAPSWIVGKVATFL